MAETAPTPIKAPQTLKHLQAMVSGKVEGNRKYNGKHYTLMACPSGDEYVPPSILEVESERKLADNGEMWRGLCSIRGYRNSYDSKDKETGEVSKVKSARAVLVAVE